MIKTTAFIGLGLCVLLLSGCDSPAPRIEGSYNSFSYDRSVLDVAKNLSNEKKVVFKAALDVVIGRHQRLFGISDIGTARASVDGKTADEVIEAASDIAISEYQKVQELTKRNGFTQPVLTRDQVLKNVRVGKGLKIDQQGDHYIADLEINNNNGTDIDMALIKLFGTDETGNSNGWIGYVRFGRNDLQGVIEAKGKRQVKLAIQHDVETDSDDEDDLYFNDNIDWARSLSSNKPIVGKLSIRYSVLSLRMNNHTYNWNDPEPSTGSAPTLPSDIDQFLTLIKYKR